MQKNLDNNIMITVLKPNNYEKTISIYYSYNVNV